MTSPQVTAVRFVPNGTEAPTAPMTMTQQEPTADRTRIRVDVNGRQMVFRLSVMQGGSKRYLNLNPNRVVSRDGEHQQTLEQAATSLATRIFNEQGYRNTQRRRWNVPLQPTGGNYTITEEGTTKTILVNNAYENRDARRALENLAPSVSKMVEEQLDMNIETLGSSSGSLTPALPHSSSTSRLLPPPSGAATPTSSTSFLSSPTSPLSSPTSPLSPATPDTDNIQRARNAIGRGMANPQKIDCGLISTLHMISTNASDRAQINALDPSSGLYFLKEMLGQLDRNKQPDISRLRNWIVTNYIAGTTTDPSRRAVAITRNNQTGTTEPLTIIREHLHGASHATTITNTYHVQIRNNSNTFEADEPESNPIRHLAGVPLSIDMPVGSPFTNLNHLVENHFIQNHGEFGRGFLPFPRGHAPNTETVTPLSKSSVMSSAPDTLCIDASRVAFTSHTVRNANRIEIPNEQLVMRGDIFQNEDNANEVVYNLTSFSRHYGGARGGHWVNYSKINNSWYLFNDDNRPIPVNTVQLREGIENASTFDFAKAETRPKITTANIRDDMRGVWDNQNVGLWEKMSNAVSNWWNPPSATRALPNPTPQTPIRRAAGTVVDSPSPSLIAKTSSFNAERVKEVFDKLANP